MKEAKARIKINALLSEAGWRFFDDEQGKANILLENNVKISQHAINDWGEDFEQTKNGFLDFLLLDEKGFPFIVLEAKAEGKNPLFGKEQARKYATAQNCRFIILSNGNAHYFWDLQRGSPQTIQKFPAPGAVEGYAKFKPNPDSLVREAIEQDYIARSQRPDYAHDPAWKDETLRPDFIQNNKLRFLRPYQLKALQAVQEAVRSRFPGSVVYADHLLDAVACGAAGYAAPARAADRITRSYALRYWDPALQEHHYRFLVHSGTRYPSAGQVARIVISATYDGQTWLGIPLYEIGGDNGGAAPLLELVSDAGGGVRLAGPAQDAGTGGQVLHANERSPTLLVADPPARRGEPRFECTFTIDPERNLCLSARDLVTGKLIKLNAPVHRLT